MAGNEARKPNPFSEPSKNRRVLTPSELQSINLVEELQRNPVEVANRDGSLESVNHIINTFNEIYMNGLANSVWSSRTASSNVVEQVRRHKEIFVDNSFSKIWKLHPIFSDIFKNGYNDPYVIFTGVRPEELYRGRAQGIKGGVNKGLRISAPMVWSDTIINNVGYHKIISLEQTPAHWRQTNLLALNSLQLQKFVEISRVYDEDRVQDIIRKGEEAQIKVEDWPAFFAYAVRKIAVEAIKNGYALNEIPSEQSEKKPIKNQFVLEIPAKSAPKGMSAATLTIENLILKGAEAVDQQTNLPLIGYSFGVDVTSLGRLVSFLRKSLLIRAVINNKGQVNIVLKPYIDNSEQEEARKEIRAFLSFS